MKFYKKQIKSVLEETTGGHGRANRVELDWIDEEDFAPQIVEKELREKYIKEFCNKSMTPRDIEDEIDWTPELTKKG